MNNDRAGTVTRPYNEDWVQDAGEEDDTDAGTRGRGERKPPEGELIRSRAGDGDPPLHGHEMISAAKRTAR